MAVPVNGVAGHRKKKPVAHLCETGIVRSAGARVRAVAESRVFGTVPDPALPASPPPNPPLDQSQAQHDLISCACAGT